MWLRSVWGLGLFAGSLGAGWALGRVGVMTEARAGRLVRWIIKGPAPVMLCPVSCGGSMGRACAHTGVLCISAMKANPKNTRIGLSFPV